MLNPIPTGKGGDDRPTAFAVRLALYLVVSAALALPASCTRRFYRKSADEEVAHVLGEKDKYPAWRIDQFHVYPDPLARFADPTNPDRPPKPPDDPATYDLSPNPQKPPRKAGIAWVEGFGYLDLLAAWDAENRERARAEAAQRAEEERARMALEAKQPGGAGPRVGPGGVGYEQPPPSEQPQTPGEKAFLITLEQAVQLGLINSREYQTRREDLYLAALPVTLERFAFAAQWFATEEAIRERFGREAPGGPTNRWVFNSNVGFNKLFPTGALLLFQLANRTVINLTGDLKHTISESTLLLDLVQPLLRGGGKAVTLEALTQAERNLLYEIRSYARFREQFYVFIAAGGDLGRAAGQVAGRAALALTPGVIAPTQGYLPILQISAQLANERRNVAALERLLEMFRAFREGELVTQLQVDQVEQQLLNSRNNVLNTELNYRDSLDRFKLQLGLPPGVDIELEASTLQPLVRQFSRYDVVVRQFAGAAGELERLRAEAIGAELQEESVGRLSGLLAAPVTLPVPAGLGTAAATTSAARLGAEPPEALLPPFPLRARVEQILTASPLVQGTQIRTRISERWVEWRKLTDKEVFERVNLLKEVRRKLELLRDKLSIEGKEFPEKDRQRLEEVYFEIDLGEMEDALRDYLTRPWRKIPDPVVRVSAQADLLQRVVRSAFSMLSRARRERLDAITESWPELPALRVGGVDLLQVDLAEAQAVVAQTALTNRFDLMNARAQLVDAWRQIAIAANALMGVFNVRYHWEAFSPFGEAKPLAIGGSRQQHQLFFNAELPLVRKSERNVYRAALISYQRQRREVMAAEDAVLVAVREEIRQLRVLAENYRIQKRLVELAYLQVENAEDTFRAPPEPVAQQRITGAATAAALTQQLLNAQASLLRAQNQTYQIWINYLTTRLFLYRDLELMPLDPRGVWIDESANLPRDAGPNGCPSAIQQPAPPGSSADERGDQLPAPRSLPSPPGGDGPP